MCCIHVYIHALVRTSGHLLDQTINVLLSVPVVAPLCEMVGFLFPAAGWVVELERPQEVGDGFEVWSGSHDFVHNIFEADDPLVAQGTFDDGVVGERSTALLHLAVPALVDEVSDCLEVRVAVGNVRLDDSDHVDGCLVELDKYGVVYLEETEELEHLSDLWCNSVDPLDSDKDSNLGLRLDVEIAPLPGIPLQPNGVPFSLSVLANVRFGPLKDSLSVCL